MMNTGQQIETTNKLLITEKSYYIVQMNVYNNVSITGVAF